MSKVQMSCSVFLMLLQTVLWPSWRRGCGGLACWREYSRASCHRKDIRASGSHGVKSLVAAHVTSMAVAKALRTHLEPHA